MTEPVHPLAAGECTSCQSFSQECRLYGRWRRLKCPACWAKIKKGRYDRRHGWSDDPIIRAERAGICKEVWAELAVFLFPLVRNDGRDDWVRLSDLTESDLLELLAERRRI